MELQSVQSNTNKFIPKIRAFKKKEQIFDFNNDNFDMLEQPDDQFYQFNQFESMNIKNRNKNITVLTNTSNESFHSLSDNSEKFQHEKQNKQNKNNKNRDRESSDNSKQSNQKKNYDKNENNGKNSKNNNGNNINLNNKDQKKQKGFFKFGGKKKNEKNENFQENNKDSYNEYISQKFSNQFDYVRTKSYSLSKNSLDLFNYYLSQQQQSQNQNQNKKQQNYNENDIILRNQTKSQIQEKVSFTDEIDDLEKNGNCSNLNKSTLNTSGHYFNNKYYNFNNNSSINYNDNNYIDKQSFNQFHNSENYYNNNNQHQDITLETDRSQDMKKGLLASQQFNQIDNFYKIGKNQEENSISLDGSAKNAHFNYNNKKENQNQNNNNINKVNLFLGYSINGEQEKIEDSAISDENYYTLGSKYDSQNQNQIKFLKIGTTHDSQNANINFSNVSQQIQQQQNLQRHNHALSHSYNLSEFNSRQYMSPSEILQDCNQNKSSINNSDINNKNNNQIFYHQKENQNSQTSQQNYPLQPKFTEDYIQNWQNLVAYDKGIAQKKAILNRNPVWSHNNFILNQRSIENEKFQAKYTLNLTVILHQYLVDNPDHIHFFRLNHIQCIAYRICFCISFIYLGIKYDQNTLLLFTILFMSRILYIMSMVKCIFFFYENTASFRIISKIFNSIFENQSYNQIQAVKDFVNKDNKKKKSFYYSRIKFILYPPEICHWAVPSMKYQTKAQRRIHQTKIQHCYYLANFIFQSLEMIFFLPVLSFTIYEYAQDEKISYGINVFTLIFIACVAELFLFFIFSLVYLIKGNQKFIKKQRKKLGDYYKINQMISNN
ncbi:hypothetical protein PPERSA_08359 [Pseudocohnilembus persalinus]|uniref:Transmembrane protein n=1 Tax=Pseudocohnilembus persalinus TaxID=266149 RepID=A0A0V0QLS0_PSEPJ|nr:hypothetical protein PPERSA_08359 [Pseudocohnilembus persalinus]|eukprot:KRX03305.1 hypothetical protein PPERSA_08359 [Pseudocohnilembus persalinus]